MKITHSIFFTLLLLYVNIFVSKAQPVKDFLVSGEDNPSTFRMQNVRLFPFTFNHSLAAWEDERDGDWGWYAQEFDSLGRLAGRNFSIPSNSNIQCLPDGSYLVLSQKFSSYFDQQALSLYGNFFGPEHQLIQASELGGAVLPWCGTGYLGIDYDCRSTSNQYLFLFRNDGHLSLSKYQSSGTMIFHPSDSLFSNRLSASSGALAVNGGNDYAVIWCSTDRNTMKYEGVYGTFFTCDDSILAYNKPLGFIFDSTQNVFRGNCILKSIALLDTSYQIFFVNADSGSIYYNKFDRSGDPLSNYRSVPIPHTGTQVPKVTNISISKIVDNSFSLLVTSSELRGESSMVLNCLYSFTSDGSYRGLIAIDSTHQFAKSGAFIKAQDSTNYFGVNDGKDIYLVRCRNLSVLDSLKLNDNLVGSNEDNSFVLPAGPNQFCILWDVAARTIGQRITFEGQNYGSPQFLEGKGLEYFSDGSSLLCWRHTMQTGEDTIGYTILGISNEIIKEGVVAAGSPVPAVSMTSKILSDSLFLVVLQENSDSAKLYLFKKNGSLVQEHSLVSPANIYGLQISMNDKQSFWMHYGSNVRLYSNLMMPLSDEKKLNARIHLQANTFLSVWAETDNLLYVPTYYGTILTVDGDTLKKKIYLVTNPSGYTVGSLADGRFLLVAGKNNFYYAQAFSKNGVKEKDSICIHSATNGSKRNPSFALNGTAICFAWSEVRSPSPGYSIYSSVMDLSTLVDVKGTPGVGVPKQNQLFQNYPNPFNPATVIKFQTSEVGKTTLRIFDVLGREVAVLLNEEQSPGIKQVEWNASGIASGIYFYKMEVYGKKNLYVESKKMLLLK